MIQALLSYSAYAMRDLMELDNPEIMEARMKKQGKIVYSDLDITLRIHFKGLVMCPLYRKKLLNGSDELLEICSYIALLGDGGVRLGINCLLDKIQDPQPETSHPQPETTPA